MKMTQAEALTIMKEFYLISVKDYEAIGRWVKQLDKKGQEMPSYEKLLGALQQPEKFDCPEASTRLEILNATALKMRRGVAHPEILEAYGIVYHMARKLEK